MKAPFKSSLFSHILSPEEHFFNPNLQFSSSQTSLLDQGLLGLPSLSLSLAYAYVCIYISFYSKSPKSSISLLMFFGFFFFLVEYNATWSSSRKFYFLGSILRMGLLAYFSSAHISLSGSRTSLHLSFTLLLDILCMCKEGSGFLLWTGISTSITLIALCHLT